MKNYIVFCVVIIVLIVMGTLIVLTPAASEYHHRTLVANSLPYLWTDAHRQGEDKPDTNEIITLENKLDGDDGLTALQLVAHYLIGGALIVGGIRLFFLHGKP